MTWNGLCNTAGLLQNNLTASSPAVMLLSHMADIDRGHTLLCLYDCVALTFCMIVSPTMVRRK